MAKCKLEGPVRQHLTNVYACVALSAVAATAGAGFYSNMEVLHDCGVYTIVLSAIGMLACLLMLRGTDKYEQRVPERLTYLLVFSLLGGMNMGPLLEYIAEVDAATIMTALVGTAVIFASFSLCSIHSEDGCWLNMGGTCLALVNALALLSLANIFLDSELIFKVDIYIGLAVMCAFVLFDTQLIIEKCRTGNKDFVTHSVDLFLDLICIFQRLVIILFTKDEEDNRRRNKN